MELYIQDNHHRLPTCARLPSIDSNLPPIMVTLEPYTSAVGPIYQCPADRTIFPAEKTSYEWNVYLNGAPYDRPEEWSPTTKAIVQIIFGGRLNTPLIGDAEPFHQSQGTEIGKNALFFDGRVAREKLN